MVYRLESVLYTLIILFHVIFCINSPLFVRVLENGLNSEQLVCKFSYGDKVGSFLSLIVLPTFFTVALKNPTGPIRKTTSDYEARFSSI